jgi:hypothetical protein
VTRLASEPASSKQFAALIIASVSPGHLITLTVSKNTSRLSQARIQSISSQQYGATLPRQPGSMTSA